MRLIKNKFIRWLWGFVYHKFRWSDYSKTYGEVIVVKGWRTATIEWGYTRMTISPCFWWFK